MTDEPPAWPPRADRPPPDAWPPHQPSAPPVSGPRLGDTPTAETPTIDAPTAETPIIAAQAFPTPAFPTPTFPTQAFDPPPAGAPVTETPFAETPFAETAPAETPVVVTGTDDTPTATVPAVREPVLVGSIVEDDDRTWHTSIPASQHFHPAHEANWPTEAGQQQWLPDIHHDEQWHPQHEQPPLEKHPDEKHPDEQDEPQPRGRRTALWLSVALVFTLLLCGGGAVSAYLLLRNADGGGGAPDPATAVTRFLNAVYSEQDPGAANDLLCSESRDTKKMTAKIDEVRGYARTYDGPQFRWAEPAVSAQEQKRATVAVDLTMTTRDEKTAQQRLTFTVVRKTGWWVCEVTG